MGASEAGPEWLVRLVGLLENQSLAFAVGSAFLFCVVAIIFSVQWRKRSNRGPLEWTMRRVTT